MGLFAIKLKEGLNDFRSTWSTLTYVIFPDEALLSEGFVFDNKWIRMINRMQFL